MFLCCFVLILNLNFKNEAHERARQRRAFNNAFFQQVVVLLNHKNTMISDQNKCCIKIGTEVQKNFFENPVSNKNFSLNLNQIF